MIAAQPYGLLSVGNLGSIGSSSVLFYFCSMLPSNDSLNNNLPTFGIFLCDVCVDAILVLLLHAKALQKRQSWHY
jgi:hypothetical protein